MKTRCSEQDRKTAETNIQVKMNIDGSGTYDIDTGNGMFDHLLTHLSKHGLIDLTVKAKGDTEIGWHHLVEDTGIVIGKALKECVGDGAGINRIGDAYAPLDEALARTVVDFSGRGYSVLELMLGDIDMGDLPADLVRHFLESFAREAGFNLNIEVLSGLNNHHKAEAAFKSMAKAIKYAVSIDKRQQGKIPSTKGSISD